MQGAVKAVLQRVRGASVTVGERVVGEVSRGVLILLGVAPDDTETDALWLARKIANLRIFEDESERMNRSLVDCGFGALVVSQFTLFGDCRKGRRPSFVGAARPEIASPLVERFGGFLMEEGVSPVAGGVFGASMQVSLVNDGPVTLVLETP